MLEVQVLTARAEEVAMAGEQAGVGRDGMQAQAPAASATRSAMLLLWGIQAAQQRKK
jgi:hypothetical protein